jgi:hypothetical protein
VTVDPNPAGEGRYPVTQADSREDFAFALKKTEAGRATPVQAAKSTHGQPNVATPDKGNSALLRRDDGQLKQAVNFQFAARFGGVSVRAIQDAAKRGKLATEGARHHRKVRVDSLLQYFPPE